VNNRLKQTCLKPQDLVLALKIAVRGGGAPTFAKLSQELFMSVSEAYAAAQRGLACRLLERDAGALLPNRQALQEFVLHGLRYAFPATHGPVSRGMPTGASAPILIARFDQTRNMPWVWPDEHGTVTGPSLCPLYPSVPAACRLDPKLYDMLAALDALRAGAAREREAAQQEVARMLA
jgi:hypothetical protein